MTRVANLKIMARRFVAAVRRHGIKRVASILSHIVFRHGLNGAIRFGQATRPFVSQMGARFDPPKVKPNRSGRPADLDNDYRMYAAAWAPFQGGREIAGADRSDSISVVFVIQGEVTGSGQARRTVEAIKAMSGDVKVWTVSDNEPVSADLNPAERRFFVFLQAGDLPSIDLPRELARAAQGGAAEVVSFDLYRRVGDKIQPLLCPGANPTLLEATDYVFSRIAISATVLPSEGELAFEDPRARVLAWLQERTVSQIRGRWRHIGRPIVEALVSDETIRSQRREVLDNAKRPLSTRNLEPVSVVICTKDKGHLTRQLARHLLAKGPERVAEVIVVSNRTANPYALQTLSDLALSPRVRILRVDSEFNFSRLSNTGARATVHKGPLLFLNDDIAPVSEDWLERLVARLGERGAGAVGPLLLYPDERVQHAGMYLGYSGSAGHILRRASLPDEDYLFTAVAPREVSCVTGAVLLTSRALFEALNGFDDQLATYLQDVDYGLRVHRAGFKNLFEPASVLIHMESTSIGALVGTADFNRQRHLERERFVERWGDAMLKDPFHSPVFDPQDETLHSLSRP